jgi:hypothetical protein
VKSGHVILNKKGEKVSYEAIDQNGILEWSGGLA